MAYTATVTSKMKKPERISRSLGVFAGTVNISSYNTTLVAITGITKYFRTGTGTIVSVIANGPTDSGFNLAWNYASKSFKAYYPTNVASFSVALPVDSNVGAGAALLFVSGGGAAALHATSAVGTITQAFAAVERINSEANDDDDVGVVTFLAVGFI